MKLIKILSVMLLILIPIKTFAAAPEISYDKMNFNFMKGYYTLTGHVRVAMDNHGYKMILTADEAQVSLLQKKCIATGKVTLNHEDITFSCDKAFAQWETNSADIVGKINFQNKDNITITADTAQYNWDERIADFYGNVKVTLGKNFKAEKNLKPDKNTYAHVRYNIEENKILALDKKFNIPKITIPDFEK